jgi:hypothetical protein
MVEGIQILSAVNKNNSDVEKPFALVVDLELKEVMLSWAFGKQPRSIVGDSK